MQCGRGGGILCNFSCPLLLPLLLCRKNITATKLTGIAKPHKKCKFAGVSDPLAEFEHTLIKNSIKVP